jgi:hypothetical protein
MTPLDTLELERLIDHGWDIHAEQPQAVAQALLARAAGLPAEEIAARAIVLADHVGLAHLHDTSVLRQFLQRLPAAVTALPACQPVLGRIGWTLAVADGSPPPAVPDALRWRGMQSLWALWIAAGRRQEVLLMLQQEQPLALAHAERDACAGLAASCNNLAVDLRTGRRGDADLDALMLALARASKALWARAGTWLHVERADYQLARCHAVLGQGGEAVQHAQAALAAVDAHAGDPQADAVEAFFAHEALAWAHRAAGHTAAAGEQRALMQARLAEVADDGSRAWCAQALTELDAAGA